jgi:hypothetical protein
MEASSAGAGARHRRPASLQGRREFQSGATERGVDLESHDLVDFRMFLRDGNPNGGDRALIHLKVDDPAMKAEMQFLQHQRDVAGKRV